MSFRKNQCRRDARAPGLLLILCVAACVVVSPAQVKNSSAQDRPDLTGTWERNPSKSESPFGAVPGSSSLTISHKEPELWIIRKSSNKGEDSINDSTYYSDGRGDMNIPTFGTAISVGPANSNDAKSIKPSGEVKSKTKWEGSKLVSRTSMVHFIGDHRLDVEIIEEREISLDGKTLTIVTTVNGNPGLTEVFDRVQ